MLHFLQYHNAIPIALGALFLGATVSFAAVNPEVFISTEVEIVSVDNTYIADKDLSTYTPSIVIAEVTEDADAYYVAYVFSTIDVEDYVWRDVKKSNVLRVEKNVLAEFEDLGLYVTEQFKQLVGHEAERLKEAQAIERAHVSNKMIATAYGGLIGKFLDETTETLPGYEPVVVPPPPAPHIEQEPVVIEQTPEGEIVVTQPVVPPPPQEHLRDTPPPPPPPPSPGSSDDSPTPAPVPEPPPAPAPTPSPTPEPDPATTTPEITPPASPPTPEPLPSPAPEPQPTPAPEPPPPVPSPAPEPAPESEPEQESEPSPPSPESTQEDGSGGTQ